jgi:hypothetical protein
MDVIMSKLGMRGNISTRPRQITAYADVIPVMARTKQTFIDTFMKLKEEAKIYGLVVNEGTLNALNAVGGKQMEINWKQKQWNSKRFNPSNI